MNNTQIKFRAWDGFSFHYFVLETDGLKLVGEFVNTALHKTWSQYIGLNDIEGTEVYADDIVKEGEQKPERVYFKAGQWTLGEKLEDQERDLFITPLDIQMAKVVGNIYQNSELLK